jgi:hypothetical protein
MKQAGRDALCRSGRRWTDLAGSLRTQRLKAQVLQFSRSPSLAELRSRLLPSVETLPTDRVVSPDRELSLGGPKFQSPSAAMLIRPCGGA